MCQIMQQYCHKQILFKKKRKIPLLFYARYQGTCSVNKNKYSANIHKVYNLTYILSCIQHPVHHAFITDNPISILSYPSYTCTYRYYTFHKIRLKFRNDMLKKVFKNLFKLLNTDSKKNNLLLNFKTYICKSCCK